MNDDRPMIPKTPEERMSADVIDLAGVRVHRGYTPGGGYCQHAKLTYSQQERRIWCEDCKRTVEGFDAFMVLVRNFGAMVRHAQAEQRRLDDACAKHSHLIATRQVEKAWRGKTFAILCPHCNGGILPEDWADGGPGHRHRDAELARRGRKSDGPNAP